MSRLIAILATVAFVHAPSALAHAYCAPPTEDGTVWNLVCIADDSHEAANDYQCDYFLSLTDSAGMTMQQEATGAVQEGQDNAVIWSSAVVGDDSQIVSVSIVSGSCSR